MVIIFSLKNGREIKITCESFKLNQNGFGPTGYEIDGIKENKPLWINWNEIAAIYRVMSDE